METVEQAVKTCPECGRTLPIENFRLTKGGGRISICNECHTRHMLAGKEMRKVQKIEKERAERESSRQQRLDVLKEYTPRELMLELRNRGYKGKLSFTKVFIADLEKL